MSKFTKNQTFITPHFRVSEWEGVASYPLDWIKDRLAPLAQALEVLRVTFAGKAIVIGAMGGYRTPAANVKVGGAKRSQHMEGRAADIRVTGVAAKEVYDMLLRLHRAGEIVIGGLGYYPELPVSKKDPRGRRAFVHVDVRPRPKGARPVTWTGRRE